MHTHAVPAAVNEGCEVTIASFHCKPSLFGLHSFTGLPLLHSIHCPLPRGPRSFPSSASPILCPLPPLWLLFFPLFWFSSIRPSAYSPHSTPPQHVEVLWGHWLSFTSPCRPVILLPSGQPDKTSCLLPRLSLPMQKFGCVSLNHCASVTLQYISTWLYKCYES